MNAVLRSFFAAAGLLAAVCAAPAQTFPDRPLTMVIPFSPAGSNDVVGRYLAENLGKLWKQSVIVENKPGAGAVIGTNYVARAKPDGLTMLFVSATYTTNAVAMKELPFDPAKDLQPVGLGALGQFVMVAGTRVPLPNVGEVIAQAKRQTLFYGTAGLGNSSHFATELFNDVVGIQMEPVHYKGGTEAMTDLSGGRIDIYLGTVTQVLPNVQAKTAFPVAVSSRTRSPAFPDVPTVRELGYPSAEIDFWWGVFVPAATPKPIVEEINRAINQVMNTPESTAFLAKHGAYPGRMSVAEFTKLVADETAKWKAIAAKHKIEIK